MSGAGGKSGDRPGWPGMTLPPPWKVVPAGGKDVGGAGGAVLPGPELLIRKTAPRSGSALLTGGYDETTMRGLGDYRAPPGRVPTAFRTLPRCFPAAAAGGRTRSCASSACCDETLDDVFGGRTVRRIARLEEQLASGVPARQTAGSAGERGAAQQPAGVEAPVPGRRSVRPCRGGTGGGADPGRAGDGLRRSRLPSRPSPEARAPSGPLSRRRPSKAAPRGPIW